jgi:hypothetical protein
MRANEMELYPQMSKRSYDRLPQVFRWIIDADRRKPDVTSMKVVPLQKGHELREWNKDRINMNIGAENYIKSRRENGPA